MRTRIFLSMNGRHNIAEQSAMIASGMGICTNVYPMYSSVHCNATETHNVEPSARIDILSDVMPEMLLQLFRRLQDIIGLHCVWLDYVGTPNDGEDFEYSGCVLNWHHYIEHHVDIGHAGAMKCSEYPGGLDTNGFDTDGNRREYWNEEGDETVSQEKFGHDGLSAYSFYLNECPDTGRIFLCKSGHDNNIAEIFDVELWNQAIDNTDLPMY